MNRWIPSWATDAAALPHAANLALQALTLADLIAGVDT